VFNAAEEFLGERLENGKGRKSKTEKRRQRIKRLANRHGISETSLEEMIETAERYRLEVRDPDLEDEPVTALDLEVLFHSVKLVRGFGRFVEAEGERVPLKMARAIEAIAQSQLIALQRSGRPQKVISADFVEAVLNNPRLVEVLRDGEPKDSPRKRPASGKSK
jgi:hypothetical protein